MYGIVNKAIEEMVGSQFGKEKWEKILSRAGMDDQGFISNESYDDAVTFQLAISASEELGIPLPDILFAFGEYWVLETGKKKYGPIIADGGTDIKNFFLYLPNLHSRVSLIFPNLKPPEFVVSDVVENGLHLHYYSHRQGLKEFVVGLISGIGKLFNKVTTTKILASREDGHDHEIFQITWN